MSIDIPLPIEEITPLVELSNEQIRAQEVVTGSFLRNSLRRLRNAVLCMIVVTSIATVLDIRSASESDDFKEDFKSWIDECFSLAAIGDSHLELTDNQEGIGKIPNIVQGLSRIFVASGLRVLRDFESCERLASGEKIEFEFTQEISDNKFTETIIPFGKDLITAITVENPSEEFVSEYGLTENDVFMSSTRFSMEGRQVLFMHSDEIRYLDPELSVVLLWRAGDMGGHIEQDEKPLHPSVRFRGQEGAEYRDLIQKTDRVFLAQNNQADLLFLQGGDPRLNDMVSVFTPYYPGDPTQPTLDSALKGGEFYLKALEWVQHAERNGESPSQQHRPNIFLGVTQEGDLIEFRLTRYAPGDEEASKLFMEFIREHNIVYFVGNDPDIARSDISITDDAVGISYNRLDSNMFRKSSLYEEVASGEISLEDALRKSPLADGYYIVITEPREESQRYKQEITTSFEYESSYAIRPFTELLPSELAGFRVSVTIEATSEIEALYRYFSIPLESNHKLYLGLGEQLPGLRVFHIYEQSANGQFIADLGLIRLVPGTDGSMTVSLTYVTDEFLREMEEEQSAPIPVKSVTLTPSDAVPRELQSFVSSDRMTTPYLSVLTTVDQEGLGEYGNLVHSGFFTENKIPLMEEVFVQLFGVSLPENIEDYVVVIDPSLSDLSTPTKDAYTLSFFERNGEDYHLRGQLLFNPNNWSVTSMYHQQLLMSRSISTTKAEQKEIVEELFAYVHFLTTAIG